MTQPAQAAGEHPLMSHKTLRAMYTNLAGAKAHLVAQPRSRAALADTACFVAPCVGLTRQDLAFTPRPNDLLSVLLPTPQPPFIPNPLHRLYAALGATFPQSAKSPVVVAFFERQEAIRPALVEAIALVGDRPLLLIVLPHTRGPETALPKVFIPAIPVDAQDPIALYRVAQESLTRARAGGGAALIEAISLPNSPTALEKLADYLTRRAVATPAWLAGKSPEKETRVT